MTGTTASNFLTIKTAKNVTKPTSFNNTLLHIPSVENNLATLPSQQHLDISQSANIRKSSEINYSSVYYGESYSPKKKKFNLWLFGKSVQRRASIANPQRTPIFYSSDVDISITKQLVKPRKSKTFDSPSSNSNEEYQNNLIGMPESCVGTTLSELPSKSFSSSTTQGITGWHELSGKCTKFGKNILDAVTQSFNLSSNLDIRATSGNSMLENSFDNAGNKTMNCILTEVPPTKLSLYTLKRDIKRCVKETHAYIEISMALHDIVIWKNPFTTLLLFFIYMYSVLRGWLVSLTFLLVLAQLGLNWLEFEKKINLGLFLFPRHKITKTNQKLNHSGAQVVFNVARQAQLLLTLLSDVLEKVRHLFQWSRPEVTIKFLYILLTLFLLSLVLSTSLWFILIGFLIGGKIFIMTFLYHRFPKLRLILDIAYYFYRNIPTSLKILTEIKQKLVLPKKPQKNSLCKKNASFRNYVNTRRASSVDIAVAVATNRTNFGPETSFYDNTNSKAKNSPMMAGALLSPMFAACAGNAKKRFTSSIKQNKLVNINQPDKLYLLNTANTNSFKNKKCFMEKTNVRRSSVNTLISPTIPTVTSYKNCRLLHQLSPYDCSFVTNKTMSSSLPITPVFPVPVGDSGVHLYKNAQSDINKDNKVIVNITYSPDTQIKSLSYNLSTQTQQNSMQINKNRLRLQSQIQPVSGNKYKDSCKHNTTSNLSCHYDTFSNMIKITRSCVIVIKTKSIFKSKRQYGTLILNDRMLSFSFENHRKDSLNYKNRSMVNSTKHCSITDQTSLNNSLKLDIPFKHIIQIKTNKSFSIQSQATRFGIAVKKLFKKSAGDVAPNPTSTTEGIELRLSLSVVWWRRENFDILGSTFFHTSNKEVVIKFERLAKCTEFYELLIETARITAGIELAHKNLKI